MEHIVVCKVVQVAADCNLQDDPESGLHRPNSEYVVAPQPFSVKANPHKHKHCGGATPPPTPPPPAPAPPPYETHGCGYKCSDSNDCDWPCTVCCANQTCCYDLPFDPPPPPSPPPSILPPAPAPAPVLGGGPIPEYAALAYQVHGCGFPCSDSNDCDWPCTLCCYQNNTCCYDLPFPEN